MADLSFFGKRWSSLPFYLVFIAIVLFLLYMVWPWKYPLILTLWGAYVLYWPTVWLEKYIHRRYLAALIVLIVTGVVLALALVSVTVIVAQQLVQLASTASASASSASIDTGLIRTFNVIPGLAKAGPIAAFIAALATSGGGMTATFVDLARDLVRQVLVSIPVLLLQLIIVFFLLLGILGRGDIIVNDFKSAVPLKYQSITNRFFDHLNPIYYSFFVIYFAVAIICGILAAIIYGLLGVPFFVTFAVFIVFVGLIPSIGRALIYVPLALWLIIQGNAITGLIVLIVSVVVFEAILRYTIQPRWMERTGRVPRPLTLIAFTFALVAFGVIGFAIGPAIVGFALAMWRTWKDIQKEQEEQASPVAQASGS
ncbi:MAG TPA: AI-2E family transporter [Candidatus Acidoferrales bacterium]|nr:AI-2E family transporter [Candidatus Acidoferrales bacterium]